MYDTRPHLIQRVEVKIHVSLKIKCRSIHIMAGLDQLNQYIDQLDQIDRLDQYIHQYIHQLQQLLRS